MSKNEGRQSPPPEQQTGAQVNDPPASGKGTDKADNKEQKNSSALDNLSSNPKGPLEDESIKKVTNAKK